MRDTSGAIELKIDKIMNGYVIDHIKAGYGMKVYKHLKLDELTESVALIQNVKSGKRGTKDMIKIQGLININLEVLGYIDPNITVNAVENGEVTSRVRLELPGRLTDVIKCRNPRCITSSESGLKQEFTLTDRARETYRCVYCEQEDR